MITKDWVRGYLDRACHIHRSSHAIVVTAADDQLLREIYLWLRKEGYNSAVAHYGDRYCLRISGLESLEKWKKEMGFIDPAKQAVLEELTREG